jgi:hypothetical protein
MKTKNKSNHINGKYTITFKKQIVSEVPQYVMYVSRVDSKGKIIKLALVAYFYDAQEYSIQTCDVAITKSSLEFLVEKMNHTTFRFLRRRFQAYERSNKNFTA